MPNAFDYAVSFAEMEKCFLSSRPLSSANRTYGAKPRSRFYDAENRLIAIESSANAYNVGVPRQRIEFQYDYLGRRVQKQLLNYSGSTWALAYQTRFIYDGWNMLAEYNTTSGFTRQSIYVWGIDLSGKIQDSSGVGGLLAVWRGENNTWAIPMYDANGNIYGLLDRAGNVRAVFEYNSFGETIRSTGDMAALCPFRFCSKYTDSETQLVYYGYRYYNPSLGRFISRDPIEEKGGNHLYAMVMNNTTNSWDALGLTDGEADFGGGAEGIWAGTPFISVSYVDGVSSGNDRFGVDGDMQYWKDHPATSSPIDAAEKFFNTDHSINVDLSLKGNGGPSTSTPNSGAVTYSGSISYKYGGVILSYGTFTGEVTSNANPAQTYQVTGTLNGVGLQLGYFKGEAPISFTATPGGEQPTLAPGATTGLFTGSLGAGVGPFNLGSVDLTTGINNASGSLSPSKPEFGGLLSLFGSGSSSPGSTVSTDTNVFKPGDVTKLEVGLGGSLSFQGVTFKTVVPVKSEGGGGHHP